MAQIVPFKGIRYNIDIVDPNDVISPPYDVISPADCISLHERHPKNVVRLILGQDMPGDNSEYNGFTRSAGYLNEWLADGTLQRDNKPVIYAYEQSYDFENRKRVIRGFTSLVKLHDYADGVILPHENTLARPKSDLARLIRATNANLDSVYGMYADREGIVDSVLDKVAQSLPVEEATDRDGVMHRLWLISDERQIDLVRQILADRQIVIADGHHRYETSLAYRDEVRLPSQDEQPCDYVMMTLVNIYSPDMVVFPTHRLVRNLPDEALSSLTDKLKAFFKLYPVDSEKMTTEMKRQGGKAIGVCLDGRSFIAAPKDDVQIPISGSDAARHLDVIVLHQLILGNMLGIDSERIRQEANIVYTRNEKEAAAAVKFHDFQAAFILNPIKLETILEMAQAGEKMPQKATYFYPKLLSGMVMRRID